MRMVNLQTVTGASLPLGDGAKGSGVSMSMPAPWNQGALFSSRTSQVTPMLRCLSGAADSVRDGGQGVTF
jgi:hypothetical protein